MRSTKFHKQSDILCLNFRLKHNKSKGSEPMPKRYQRMTKRNYLPRYLLTDAICNRSGVFCSKPGEWETIGCQQRSSFGRTMREKPEPRLKESPVRNGRTHNRIGTVSPMWEITTSVGIPMELPNPRCGATPLIQNVSARTALFPSAPL